MDTECVHISETELTRDIRAILHRVETGTEVIIERNTRPLAILRPVAPVSRKLSECIAMLSGDSTATIDRDFARDVQAAIDNHREPLEPPAWD